MENGELVKQMDEITEEFLTKKNFNEFSRRIEEIASRSGKDTMAVYKEWADHINLKKFGGPYLCEPARNGSGNCNSCVNFVENSKRCGEESLFTTLYRVLDSDRKPFSYQPKIL